MGGCICEQLNEHSSSARKIRALVYGKFKIFVRAVVAHDANAPAEVRLEALHPAEISSSRPQLGQKSAVSFTAAWQLLHRTSTA